jgi:hypothetical protein
METCHEELLLVAELEHDLTTGTKGAEYLSTYFNGKCRDTEVPTPGMLDSEIDPPISDANC